MTKHRVLVEQNRSRYVGEVDLPDGHEEDYLKTHAPGGISLTKAYELLRIQRMGPGGAETSFAFVPIGIDGAQNWTVLRPEGYRIILASDSIDRAYRDTRAQEAGLVLTPEMPTGGLLKP